MTTQILVHHGIKGQKWGVKNGPPYPLGEGDKSRAEKRASSGRHASKKETSPSKKFWTDERKATAKKIAKGTAITAAVVLAAYGGYKLSQTPAMQELGKKSINAVFGDASEISANAAKKIPVSETVLTVNPLKRNSPWQKQLHELCGCICYAAGVWNTCQCNFNRW